MLGRTTILAMALAALASPIEVGAQTFEGIITERSLEMEEGALVEIIYGEEEEPDFDSEAEWLRYTANRLFGIPIGELADRGAEVEDVTMYVKGTKFRYSSTGGATDDSYMMMDVSSMTTWIVMPEEKAYIEITREAAEEAAAEATRQAEEMMKQMGLDPDELADQPEDLDDYGYEMDEEVGFAPSVRPLGRSEVINGVQADAYHAEAGSEVGLAWCAEDVTGMIAAMRKLTAEMETEEEDEWDTGGPSVDELMCDSQLPVRTQVFRLDDMGGGLWYTVKEILSIEGTSLDRGLFEIPDGFEKRTMMDMFR